MRVEAVEQQIDGSVTPDEYYFSFAGDPHEVARFVGDSAACARELVAEASGSQSNTPQDLSRTSRPFRKSTHQKEPMSRQDSHDSSCSSSPVDTASPSMFLDHYTYPPGVSGQPEPRSISGSSDTAWTTWIRKQPRKVLGVPAKLPFAGRLPFTYWGHSGKRDTSLSLHDDAVISSEDGMDMMEGIDLVSKEKEFLKTTFGLGEREEVIYRMYR